LTRSRGFGLMLGFPDGAAVRLGACEVATPLPQRDDRALPFEQAMHTSDGV